MYRIAETNPGASVEAIDYPALLSPYGPSSANGTLTTVRQIMSYVDSCPKAKLILLGYSQGKLSLHHQNNKVVVR